MRDSGSQNVIYFSTLSFVIKVYLSFVKEKWQKFNNPDYFAGNRVDFRYVAPVARQVIIYVACY